MTGEQYLAEISCILDRFYGDAISCCDLYRLMSNLFEDLRAAYDEKVSEQITNRAHNLFREHNASLLILQDPFTSHSISKPRGYAGDAVLLDFIYEHSSMKACLSG